MEMNYEDLSDRELLILIVKALNTIYEKLTEICKSIKEIKTRVDNKTGPISGRVS